MTYWDGSWWDSNRGGSTTKQQGGHGDPDNLAARQCLTATTSRSPPGHAHGRDLQLDLGQQLGDPQPEHRAPQGELHRRDHPRWSVQLTLDAACWGCHSTIGGIVDMRHERDRNPAPGAVLFGTHLSRSNGDTLPLPVPNDFLWPGPYPVDQDISTNASGSTYYAPCISCHDPHGTGAPAKTAATTQSNFMLRDSWLSPSILCKVCHP